MFNGIRNYDEFREFVEKNVVIGRDQTVDGIIYWYVAVQEARLVSEAYNTKDIASLFLGGIKPMNSPQQVTEYFETFWEDVNYTEEELKTEEGAREFVESEIPNIIAMQKAAIEYHFGIEVKQ